MINKSCPNCGSKLSNKALNRCSKCNCKIPSSASAFKTDVYEHKQAKQIILYPKFCSSCGSKAAKEAHACPSCGQPFINQDSFGVNSDDSFWVFWVILIILIFILW